MADPFAEYGYLWWLDRAGGYAYMAGLYGQIAVVDPGQDLVAVFTAHVPASIDGSSVTRWLLEATSSRPPAEWAPELSLP